MPFRNRISRRIHPICFGMLFRFYLIKDLLWKTLLNFFEQRSEANLILEPTFRMIYPKKIVSSQQIYNQRAMK